MYTQRFPLDLLERTLWTAAQAAAGVLLVAVGDLPQWWAPVLAAALAAVKGTAAGLVGVPGSAATLPAPRGPAAAPAASEGVR
ncbi:hypothetical protein [Allostreptomyces psammosilenae]|uniref:Holin n=1 Tax=Allostreptomyces psammosilenae TaxID=1892865 RepID=A0A853A437_9ACTN|nr:hypothetical protein [Allostreptomyces psammosilenae]NYI05262.1 hypothetical protein [Allostreptomyces psammosilenae]